MNSVLSIIVENILARNGWKMADVLIKDNCAWYDFDDEVLKTEGNYEIEGSRKYKLNLKDDIALLYHAEFPGYTSSVGTFLGSVLVSSKTNSVLYKIGYNTNCNLPQFSPGQNYDIHSSPRITELIGYMNLGVDNFGGIGERTPGDGGKLLFRFLTISKS